MSETLSILDPSGVPPERERVRPARRPASLEGLRLGFLDNTKPNSDKLLRRLDERLRARFSLASANHYRKRSSSSGAGADLLERIARECDLVVNAVPD